MHTSEEVSSWIEKTDLFVPGAGGFFTHRIPALIVTYKGTVLAFCEARRVNRSDRGSIDLVLRRSSDNGRTWSDVQVVVHDEGMTCGNTCPVVDRDTQTIWLPFCKNPTGQKSPRTVWVTKSVDDGANWSEPLEITSDRASTFAMVSR